MPLFNFRRGGAKAVPPAGAAAQTESVDVLRKRAKHRLIGTAVLVLAGVVGFPLLFDTQPRPVAIDIPIEIPARNAVKPLRPAAPSAAASTPVTTPREKVTAASSLDSKEEILPAAPALPTPTPAPVAQTEARQPPAEAKPAARAAASDDAARAASLLNGGNGPAGAAAADDGRVVVQVGAYADADKAREARLKLEKAGLKTYTQVAETKDGKRIRVRVGPFANRAEAEKAASKIKALDLPAAVLTL